MTYPDAGSYPGTTVYPGAEEIRGHLLQADWDGDGDFDGTWENVTSRVLGSLTVGWGRESGRAFGPSPAGKLTFGLRNDDRLFMPNYPTSPLYGTIEQGRRVNLTLNSATLFDGVLDEFDIDRQSAAKDFSATCLDGWGRPGGENLSTALHRGIWTGEAVHVVLDAIGWTGPRDIDRGDTFMQDWWAEDEDAATAIEKILDSEGPGATAYVEGGTFIFRSRFHRVIDSRSLNSQAVWSHAIPAGTAPVGSLKVAPDYDYNFGTRNIVNTVRFTVDERTVQPYEQVWSTDETYYIAEGSTIALEAQATDPFINAATPEEGTDYTLLSGSVNIWLWRTSGQATAIYVQAVGGTAIVRGLALRAQPVKVTRQRKVTAVDLPSVRKHGVQTWERTAPWCNRWDADAIAKMIVSMYCEARPSMAVTITNLDSTYATEIQARRISDRITVQLDDTGFDGDIHVERIEQQITKLGVIHKLTVWGEPVVENPDNVLILDDPVNGVLDAGFVWAREGIPTTDLLILDDPVRGVLDQNHWA